MSREFSSPVLSVRPASRRLHRRLARHADAAERQMAAIALAAPSATNSSFGVTQTLLPLPEGVVRAAGMFELLAAEQRIAELELALAEARQAATVDPLTGALNRRGFEEASQREAARAQRNGTPLALALLDLDDFKRLNDTLGHQVGDAALVHLVRVLRRAMRPSDVLARFGGEEFVLLLPETGLPLAEAALARFQRELAALPVPDGGAVLTFSAGVTCHRPDEALETTMRRADAATYLAKRSGKNRVVTA